MSGLKGKSGGLEYFGQWICPVCHKEEANMLNQYYFLKSESEYRQQEIAKLKKESVSSQKRVLSFIQPLFRKQKPCCQQLCCA